MHSRRFFQFTILAFGLNLWIPSFASAKDETKQIVVKADDVSSINPKWHRFFEVSKKLGVKVTAGIIANSLEKHGDDYYQWVLNWKKSGTVEFWNHGWDHRRWEENGKMISEFGGSGYEHQKTHLQKAQEASLNKLELTLTTFGSPYNALDQDTAKALNEIPEIKRVFVYLSNNSVSLLENKILLPMHFTGESDGVGKPNFQKFKARYETKKDLKFSALQFHPGLFTDEGIQEYTEIVKFLKSEGWSFVFSEEIESQP